MDNSDDLAETIFRNAVQITEADSREQYIRKSCAEDAGLEFRVRALLNVAAEKTSRLESAAATTNTVDFVFDDSENVGSVIGPYELIELIGAGGMGLVFLAQQNSPVRRQVALKIIRPGMDDRVGVRRFEAERQTLAHLNHPGIARLLDAGTTTSGRPWFVMELAQGIPITEFCIQKALPLEERLRLFELVCDAIDHAHQQGVIHRDIKPANVLVTAVSGRYLPKIIDFGVARINPLEHQHHRRLRSAEAAVPETILGTPAYMSPEQTYMPDHELDARSDVYSLGILLYKILTETNPFQGIPWRDFDYLETRRIIHEVSPPLPSEQVLNLAGQNASKSTAVIPSRNADLEDDQSLRSPPELRRLAARLKGDLDWITMKAIEKNRDRRYGSVGELTAEIQRHLRHEPVQAVPPSRVYRFRKLIRRRMSRLVLLTLTLCLLLLLSFSLIIARMLLFERGESERFRRLVFDGSQAVDVRDDMIHNQNYATEMQTGFAAYFRGNVDRARAIVQQFAVGPDPAPVVGFEWYFLHELCRDSPNILTGDDDKVFSVTFSPDGSLLASAAWADSGSGSVQIREAQSGALVQSIRAFENDVNAVCFNTDGSIVLAADDSGRVSILDTRTGDLKGHLGEFEHGVSQIFLASDDRTLIASEVDWGPLKAKTSVWDLKTQTRTLLIEQQRMLDVDESLGMVATVGDDGTISLRRFPDLDIITSFSDKHTAADCGCLSQGGKLLATGNKLGTVRIWQTDSLTSELLFEPQSQAAAIRDLEFSPDDQYLFVALSDGVVQVWNVPTLTLQRVLTTEIGNAWSLDVSPDGQILATGCEHGHIELRNIADLSPIRKVAYQNSPPFRALAHDAAGENIAVVDAQGGMLELHSLRNNTLLRSVRAPEDVEFQNVAFSADDQTLWVADTSGSVYNLNPESGDLVRQPILTNLPLSPPIVSNDGAFLGLNSILPTEHTAVVWDIQLQMEVFRIPVSPAMLEGERPVIDGFLDNHTVLEHTGGILSQWNYKTGEKILPEFPSQPYRISRIAFSPDKKTLLVGLSNADVYFVDVATRKSIGVLQGMKEVLAAAAFSLDGKTLATATESGRIQLWHVSTRQLIYELPRLSEHVVSLWFTREGRRLFVAVQAESGDRHIVVWDASAR
ncbi:MAG: protein kinase [Planctomycetaceae bacterium]|nr:protein kinase [Planctomycetaceae bacterium]